LLKDLEYIKRAKHIFFFSFPDMNPETSSGKTIIIFLLCLDTKKQKSRLAQNLG